jgi:RNA polymerase sigma-70 factor, ECF subfamily
LALRQEELTSLCDDVDLERDRALVERCQAGDSSAFGNLYARYYERLLRFCLRRLNDRHEAEDAAQEAFARAWKALPRFAGERRFYPWLTVIAGNICTDMLRRRSRSTPTDDMELTAQHPVGVAGEDTSEELVLAAVDGELVNRALGRLSTRHRHVLAMREGSGWTYQQIADHEGVEIGTIETLLWRARQALKREFAVVSESKEALAGFLIATGALLKRGFFRAAHRGASVHHQSGSAGEGLRNAVAGVAVTGAAVAAAFIAPHALSSGPSSPPGAAGAALAAPQNVFGEPYVDTSASGVRGAGGSLFGDAAGALGAAGGSGFSGSGSGSSRTGTASSGADGGKSGPSVLGGAGGGGLGGSLNQAAGGLSQAAGGLNNTVSGVTSGLGTTVSGIAGAVGGTVSGATKGVSSAVSGATKSVSSAVGGVTKTATSTVGGVTSGASSAVGSTTQQVNGLSSGLGLGNVLPGSGSSSSGAGSSSKSASTSTTTTTTPVASGLGGTVGSLGDAVGGLLGG